MPTSPDAALLGPGGLLFMGLYLVSLILIGIAGRLARREDSMSDFYLAGRNMGVFVLFLTLFATQYSGNTLIGFAGKAYREGYQALVLVPLMMVVVGAYLVYAPKLFLRSQRKEYITIGDYVHDRFGSTLLTVLVSVACIVALANYVLTNLKAIGYIVEAVTGGVVPFAQGIIGLAVIMVIYETLGGLRSVAWTDAIQGVLLLLGCGVLFAVLQVEYGGLTVTAERLRDIRPEFWVPPDASGKRLWLSTMLISAFGISVYPHAIQRIYAAKNVRTLRRSFQIMVFMPLVTALFMVVVGVVGAAQIPGLDRQASDQVTLLLLGDMVDRVPGIEWLIVLFLSAAVAAIMSTVDSALLAISSLFTQDLFRRVRPASSQAHLTRVGKLFSWLMMALVVYLAIVLPQTIWRLLEIKLELLCQVAPALFLGLHLPSLRAPAMTVGFVGGTLVALFFIVGSDLTGAIEARPWGVHAGIWGLLANVLVIGGMTALRRSQESLLSTT